MQPERQISVALLAIAAAVVIPVYLTLSRHPDAVPGTSLAVGAVLGAIGILLGSLVAAGHSAASARAVGLGFWTLMALALSGATWLGAAHSLTWVGRMAFGIAGFLPLAGPILALIRRQAP